MKVKLCVYVECVYPLLDLFSMLKQVLINTFKNFFPLYIVSI